MRLVEANRLHEDRTEHLRLDGMLAALSGCDWVRHAQPILISGATGCGKTWLSCALPRHAARSGLSVLYARCHRLLQELRVAHGEGTFTRRLGQLARVGVLLLDDFAGAPIAADERTDLLELPDDRVGTKATIITSQLAVNTWHAWLDDPTIADVDNTVGFSLDRHRLRYHETSHSPRVVIGHDH